MVTKFDLKGFSTTEIFMVHVSYYSYLAVVGKMRKFLNSLKLY